jgi:CRP-like cAMP-binding protein
MPQEDKATPLLKLELKRVDLLEWIKIDEMLGIAPLFKALGPASTDQLLSAASTRRVQDGQPVYLEGTSGNSLFLVLRGEAILSRGQGQTATEVATLHKGDFFGEGEVLGPKTTRSYSARARGQTDLAEMPYTAIYAMTKKHFEVYGLLRETRDAREKAKDDLADFLNRW